MKRERWQYFLRALAQARRQHPAWFLSPEAASPLTSQEVALLETKLGVHFPAEIVWFLAEVGPGDLAFSRVYGADRNPFDNLRVKDKHLVFADNGCGDLYGICLEPGSDDSIWLFTHDVARWEPSGHKDFVDWLQHHCIPGVRDSDEPSS